MAIDAAADGTVRNGAGALAGSALRLDRAVQNVVVWGIAGLDQAVTLASDNPARLLGREPAGHVRWGEGGTVLECRLGDVSVAIGGERVR